MAVRLPDESPVVRFYTGDWRLVTGDFLADRALHLQFDQAVEFDGVLHREFPDDRLDKTCDDHCGCLLLGEATAHEIEELVVTDLGHGGLVPDLGVGLFDLHVGVGVRATLVVEDQRITTNEGLHVLRTALDPHEAAITTAAAVLGDRLGGDQRGRVRSSVNDLGTGIQMLTLSGKGDGENLSVSPSSINHTAGYFIVSLDPRFPSIHSIVALRYAAARLVTRL